MTKTLSYLLLGLIALTAPLAAQTIEGAITIPSEFDIHDRGWAQLRDLEEVSEFLFALVEAMAMTAAIAFHPRIVARRRGSNDWDLPRSMFLYALIGLVVGFLVIHHGVLIGFVVFGIGGLFRFRMETLSASDTALMIFVALIGLSIGLDLPVMALLLTIAAAVVLSVFSRQLHISIEIKFDNTEDFTGKVARLRDALSAEGFATRTVTKSKFKPFAEIVLSTSEESPSEALAATLTKHQAKPDSGIEDWHIE
ncbi:hypothetical protein [Marivita geojedonensis]|uniref:DUF4956 domain-containing protein n=1 Tax=Marivita geojedonensis TaxID=1123756 RepID=A0A1X4NP44_9RHOB|nr:hypothetical protein [Marivita geojedonensis]OSQ52424.1 hypothetical protein MGEO_03280 [Marivita geojedonensis]PRY73279.1 hypothetical protein CLV76_13131 [Marivita geojedonensis]